MLDSHLEGCGDHYKWTQTEEEITCEIRISELMQVFRVSVEADKDGRKSKAIKNSLRVALESRSIRVSLEAVCLFAGEFSLSVDPEGSTWYLDSNDKEVVLMVLIEKRRKGWWESCFIGESKVDISGVQGKKSFRDCDGRLQSKILELIGGGENGDSGGKGPLDIHNVLKESWNKENSPFQGMEYDPELVEELLVGTSGLNGVKQVQKEERQSTSQKLQL